MKVVGADILVQAQKDHANARKRLAAWKAEVEVACWRTFQDVRERFPTVDRVGKRYVFDIGGNSFRLITSIDFTVGLVRIRWFGTHAEYDKLDVEGV